MPVHSLFLSSYTVRCTFPLGIVQRNSKHWVCSHTQQNECVSSYYLYASFCYYPGISPDPLTIRKEFNHMGKNRTRNNEFKFFLSDDEKALLEAKWKASGLPSRSSYIRNLNSSFVMAYAPSFWISIYQYFRVLFVWKKLRVFVAFYSNYLEYINIYANKYIHLWTQCPQVDTKFIDYSDSLHLSFLLQPNKGAFYTSFTSPISLSTKSATPFSIGMLIRLSIYFVPPLRFLYNNIIAKSLPPAVIL